MYSMLLLFDSFFQSHFASRAKPERKRNVRIIISSSNTYSNSQLFLTEEGLGYFSQPFC